MALPGELGLRSAHESAEVVLKESQPVRRAMTNLEQLPPSPRDSKITLFDRLSTAFYIGAGICGYMAAGLWGLGLVSCIYLATLFDGMIANEHREESIELIGKALLQTDSAEDK